MKLFTIRHASGRNLDISESGNPNGYPVIFHHGTPGSRYLSAHQISDASERGIRLIGYSRPGYGGSTPQPGRKIIDTASDVGAIADFLRIEKFAVAGHSGGGANALACAYAMPDRVVGASSVAAVAPFNAEGLDYYGGMGDYNIEDFKMLQTDPAKWEENNRRDMDLLIHSSSEEFAGVFASLLSEVDKKALTGDFLDMVMAQAKEGSSESLAGLRDDNLADLSPWGFDPSQIKVPVQIWHGSEDRFVPFQHGKWLAERMPGAEAHLLQNEGHISIFENRISEIHQWLVEKF